MNRSEVIEMIGDGSFVTVEFVKVSTGELRKLNGRMGVKRYTKGVGKKFSDEEKDLITIWEKDVGYRSFKVSNLKSIKAHGKEWKFG